MILYNNSYKTNYNTTFIYMTEFISQSISNYPYSFSVNCKYAELLDKSAKIEAHQIDETAKYSVQSRVTTIRNSSSKLYFSTVNILNGENIPYTKFQIVFAKQYINSDEQMSIVKKIRMGDIIGVSGWLGKTKVGEPSIFATEVVILAPCLHEIPKEHFAITDIDVKYRKRYLDMIVNESTRYNLITRSKIISNLRTYLNNQDFLEVETPILHTNYGGANAQPFITLHNDYKMNMYMRIAPELFLKQLIIGGMGKIYEIGKQFRNESCTTYHNPEFTSIELYWSPADYNNMLVLCENIIRFLVYSIHGKYQITYKGVEIDFSQPFRQVEFIETIESKSGEKINLESETLESDLKQILIKHDIKCSPPQTIPRMLDKLAGHFIEVDCTQPTFIMHHPRIMSPLAKPHRTNPLVTERFELFILHHEYANAYTELNIPDIQAQAFIGQAQDKTGGDVEAQPADMDFVHALEHGLPPTGGLGIGIDRLVMMITGQETIREILAFPTMKP